MGQFDHDSVKGADLEADSEELDLEEAVQDAVDEDHVKVGENIEEVIGDAADTTTTDP